MLGFTAVDALDPFFLKKRRKEMMTLSVQKKQKVKMAISSDHNEIMAASASVFYFCENTEEDSLKTSIIEDSEHSSK